MAGSSSTLNLRRLPAWLQNVADATQAIIDRGEDPTPSKLNAQMGRSKGHSFNGNETKVRAMVMKKNGYRKDTSSGRWKRGKQRGRTSRS
jgi:hypothetical protein